MNGSKEGLKRSARIIPRPGFFKSILESDFAQRRKKLDRRTRARLRHVARIFGFVVRAEVEPERRAARTSMSSCDVAARKSANATYSPSVVKQSARSGNVIRNTIS